jgi:thiazole synthase ThiGH ThiG subunit
LKWCERGLHQRRFEREIVKKVSVFVVLERGIGKIDAAFEIIEAVARNVHLDVTLKN